MGELVLTLAAVGVLVLVPAGVWALGRRARRRGIGGSVLGPFEEIWDPVSHRTQIEVQLQAERAAPAPAPGDPPAGPTMPARPASPLVPAQRVVLRHLDEHDPDAVRIGDPALDQPPRLPPRLAEDRCTRSRQAVDLRNDVADLEPQRHPAHRAVGAAGHLEQSVPGEEDQSRLLRRAELPVHGQAEDVPVEGLAPHRVGGTEEHSAAQHLHAAIVAQSCDAEGMTVDDLLAASRRGVQRLGPEETVAAAQRGALVVDTRTEAQRRRQGELPRHLLPGVLVIDRTVLEWRLDPASDSRIPEATGADLQVVVVCRQGYSSSLAVASLRALGLPRSTDLAGGVQAWLDAGLPTVAGPADVRE
jgi:rhodanese-related sulfurtransferase